ncbi:cyclase family protein [Chloroflexota bacterium]
MAHKIIDLSVPFGHMDSQWARTGRQEFRYVRNQCHNIAPPGGQSRQVSIFYTANKVGTHIEAPIDSADNGITIDKIPLDRFYGTGVVVDFRYMKKWDSITAEDFEKAKPKIEPGDIVIVNTGWNKYWRVNDYAYWNHYPGLVQSGANWLVKKKIKFLAGTWGCRDHPLAHIPLARTMPWLYEEYVKETGKDPDKEWPNYEPCHFIISNNEIPCIECAGGDIDKMTGKRCTLAAFPFRLLGAPGTLVRLVAIIEE